MTNMGHKLIILGLERGAGTVIGVEGLKWESGNILELINNHVNLSPHIVNIKLKLMREWMVGLKGTQMMIITWRPGEGVIKHRRIRMKRVSA